MTVESRFIRVEARAELYRGQIETDWLADHQAAMACFEVADILVQGADLFGQIDRLDTDWRILVHRGELPYCAEFEKRIARLYALWLEASEKALGLHDRIAKEYAERGFDVDALDALRRKAREARAMLGDDREIAEGDKLVGLRDAAIDAYRSGHTVEMQ